MKRIFKIFTSLITITLVATNVSACGIHYVRLNKDLSKWDINTIFSNSGLLQAIDDSKTINLKNALNSFYKPCFDQNS